MSRLQGSARSAFLFLVVALFLVSGPSFAQVVALGASNTASPYPTELEALLRQNGLNVHVRNAGIYGDTTAGMLARLDRAVPSGTRVVLLQPGGNDARNGQSSYTDEIVSRLRQRGIEVIMVDNALLGSIPAQFRRGIHFTPEGYRYLARQLLPRVVAGLR